MALKKVGPVEAAIKVLDDTIKDLQMQKAALLATLPHENIGGHITHLTRPDGRKRPIKRRRSV